MRTVAACALPRGRYSSPNCEESGPYALCSALIDVTSSLSSGEIFAPEVHPASGVIAAAARNVRREITGRWFHSG